MVFFMAILALEASTASAKAMIYQDGNVLAVSQTEYPNYISNGSTADAGSVIETLLDLGARLVAESDAQIEIISLGSIWHSLLLLDGGYKPVSPLYLWSDTSPAPTVAKYKAVARLEQKLYQQTGCPVHSIYNLWKWQHLVETGDISRAAYVSNLPQFLFCSLTGVNAISRACASGSGFFNIHTLEFDDQIIKSASLGNAALGRLVDSDFTAPILPEIADKLAVPQGTAVCVTMPDGALNQIGRASCRERV